MRPGSDPWQSQCDTSHEVQCLSTVSRAIVDAPVYLTDAIRSQGFSPSQRLHPASASWRSFTPLPSVGFGPSELFPSRPAVTSLDALCSLAVRGCAIPSRVCRSSRGFRALLRSDSRTLVECEHTLGEPLLSWSFSSSRSSGHLRQPLGFPSRAWRRTVAPQGIGRTRLSAAPESHANLHEVCHLVSRDVMCKHETRARKHTYLRHEAAQSGFGRA